MDQTQVRPETTADEIRWIISVRDGQGCCQANCAKSKTAPPRSQPGPPLSRRLPMRQLAGGDPALGDDVGQVPAVASRCGGTACRSRHRHMPRNGGPPMGPVRPDVRRGHPPKAGSRETRLRPLASVGRLTAGAHTFSCPSSLRQALLPSEHPLAASNVGGDTFLAGLRVPIAGAFRWHPLEADSVCGPDASLHHTRRPSVGAGAG